MIALMPPHTAITACFCCNYVMGQEVIMAPSRSEGITQYSLKLPNVRIKFRGNTATAAPVTVPKNPSARGIIAYQ